MQSLHRNWEEFIISDSALQMVTSTKCVEPNDEIQIDFGGPMLNEKGIEQFFITSIDRYSKYPTAEVVNNASSTY